MNRNRFIELLSKKESGEISLMEQKELLDLTSQNPLYAHITEELKTFSTDTSNFNKVSDDYIEAQWSVLHKQLNISPEKESVSKIYSAFTFKNLAIAASVIAIIIIAGILFFNKKENKTLAQQNVFSTKKASKSNLVLPDGSQVWLNTDTKIFYNNSFGAATREVTLTGEAYFDVKHDEHRPFIIHTGKADIRVLGTAFNVRNYERENFISTSLIRGKIEVEMLDEPDKKIILKPSERLTIYKTEQNVRVNALAQNKKNIELMKIESISINDSMITGAAWLQEENRVSFVNKPLTEIAKELERSYGIKVLFRSGKAKNYRYTIYLDNYGLTETIQALQTLRKFDYEIKNNELLIE